MITDENLIKETIARRVAKELKDGYVVNLGIGLPTMVANYLEKEVNVSFQSENGIIGMGAVPEKGEEDENIINAGGQYSSVIANGAFFDSATSFALIRGGHVDVSVLGALQVDEEGNLANWIIPGKMVPGMGGAMDLVTGSKKVILAMSHNAKGKAKILKKCTLPLTAKNAVDLIVTELGVMEVTKEGLILKEISKDTTIEEIKSLTEATLIIPEDIKFMM